MEKIIFRFRVWLANILIRLARWVRPKEMSEFMKSLEDSFIYGNGCTRVDPKEMFRV